MSYLVVSVDGEVVHSSSAEGCGAEEQLAVYQQFREEYPNSKVMLEIKDKEPFMGW
jgi:hypothetical protein